MVRSRLERGDGWERSFSEATVPFEGLENGTFRAEKAKARPV